MHEALRSAISPLAGAVGGGVGGMLGQLGEGLSLPRRMLWRSVGLPDHGSEVLSQNLGMDPESIWTQALGMALEMGGDPLTYAGSGLGAFSRPLMAGANKLPAAASTLGRGAAGVGGMLDEAGGAAAQNLPAALKSLPFDESTISQLAATGGRPFPSALPSFPPPFEEVRQLQRAQQLARGASAADALPVSGTGFPGNVPDLSLVSHANVTYDPAIIGQLPSIRQLASGGQRVEPTFARMAPQTQERLAALGLGAPVEGGFQSSSYGTPSWLSGRGGFMRPTESMPATPFQTLEGSPFPLASQDIGELMTQRYLNPPVPPSQPLTAAQARGFPATLGEAVGGLAPQQFAGLPLPEAERAIRGALIEAMRRADAGAVTSLRGGLPSDRLMGGPMSPFDRAALALGGFGGAAGGGMYLND